MSKALVGAPTPTVDTVRRRLGGRAGTGNGAGEVVRVRSPMASERIGVVLFISEGELDVWIGEGRVLRTTRADVDSFHGETPPDLLDVAADARVFAGLTESARVRYDGGGGQLDEGQLVEKCRYGALILRDDGVVIGVGFRRIWPLAVPSVEQN